MKITAFNGSPKGKRSNTNVMVETFLAGAEETGAEVENIQLAEKKIEHCIGCFTCWVKTPGKCYHDDDQAELIEKFLESDIVVYATPLYVDNVTGIMKDFMDRIIPILDPHFITDDEGETRHPLRFGKTPKMVVISNCGFPDQSQFQVLRLLFRRVAKNFHSEVIAEIYRDGGGLLQVKVPEAAPIIEGYKKLLRKAGSEVATTMKLSDETIAQLEQTLIPRDMSLAHANNAWDAQIARFEKDATGD